MSSQIVECVPNFSEGRRPEVVEAILAAVKGVRGATLLDYSLDEDHNRSVVTFVGPPEAVETAAFSAIARAADLIDLNEHRGEHPRIGATDVVPFVPIAGVSMEDCVEIARRLGERVGRELGIPVYLYEQAATRPERQNLADIRRGEYETLKGEIGRDPARRPDYGPQELGPAGATVIGARQPLIAYNVYLTTDDVSIAKKIARAVRHSSGGLRYVKALGLLVEGRAQVSMNLTNFRGTPVFRVVDMIRREAARYGVGVHSSELIGLIPQEALIDAATWHLQLDDFKPDQILEYRMASAREDEETLEGFLEAVASGQPTPGGGSAAAHAAALAAALAAMVARLTVGKKRYKQVEARMQEIVSETEALRGELSAAVAEDAAAFEALMAAYRLPKESKKQGAERAKAVEQATLRAAEVPLEVAHKSVEVLKLAAEVVAGGNANAITDGASGAALARAALQSAGLNVRVNLQSLDEGKSAERMLAELAALEARAAELEGEIAAQLKSRAGLVPG